MNLAPLIDYMSLLSGIYGIVVIAISGWLLALTILTARAGGSRSWLNFMTDAVGTPVSFICLGFVLFAMYTSTKGSIYNFWPLTLSLYAMLCPVGAVGFLHLRRDEGYKDIKSDLIFTFVSCMFFSPAVAGTIILNTKLSLWGSSL